MEDESQEPEKGRFARDAAEEILSLRFGRAIQSRIAHLATKANEGELTDEERAEYNSLVDAADTIAVLQARARLILDQDP